MHHSPLPPPEPPPQSAAASAPLAIFSLQSHSDHDKTDFADWAINEAVGPDKFDLLSPECIPTCNDDDTASTCSSTDSEASVRRPVESISAVTVPKFDQVLHVCDPATVIPTTLQHLHRVTSDIKALDIGLSDYYADLRAISPLLSADIAPRAHVDGGSIATTTDRKDYLFSFRTFSPDEIRNSVVRLKVADDSIHVPSGVGYLKIPSRTSPFYLYVKCYFTPQIPATIVSPDAMAKSLDCTGYATFSSLVDDRATMQLVNCTHCDGSIDFDLQVIRGLLFTESLIAPTNAEHTSTSLVAGADDFPTCVADATSRFDHAPVRALTGDQQRALWHCRLGHTHSRNVSDLHKYVDGIPKLPRSDPLSECPFCKQAKLHKADHGPNEDFVPDVCWQDIQIDLGFMIQSSKRKDAATPSSTPRRLSRQARRQRERERFRSRPISDVRSMSEGTRRSTRLNRFSGSYSESTSQERPNRVARSMRPQSGSPSPGGDSTLDDPRTVFRPPPSSETYSFEKIVAHQGPLSTTDKKYRGEPFSLKILWSTKEHTWEPLSQFFADQPDEVIEYATKFNLLGNRHWSKVRDLAMSPEYTAPIPRAFHEEFDYVPDDIPAPTAEELSDKPERYKRALGVNGETCYVIITDRKSGAMRISIRRNKEPPLDFLSSFIANYKPNNRQCRVRFDGGGELGGNSEVHDLFRNAGYDVEVTPPNSSNAIGLAERPHRTIAACLRTMLFAAGLELKYWPYALQYYALIHNCLPHGARGDSAYTICTGKRFNASLFRVFGCRIYVLPTADRDVKLDVHARTGIFLGYRDSMRTAVYLDTATGRIKTARHVAFDEGMADVADPPPYVKYLRNPEQPLELVDLERTVPIDVSLSPFSHLDDVQCAFRPQDEHSLGIQFSSCPRFRRAYAADFLRPFGPHDVPAARRKFLGGYITKIGDTPVFSLDDVRRVLRDYAHMPAPPPSLLVRISRDLRSELADTRPASLSLRPVDIRRIAAMNLVAGEGPSLAQRERLRAVAASPIVTATPADPDDLQDSSAADLLEMRKLSNDHMTDEEKALPSFTRRRLMTLSNWHEWQAADDKQLDQHFDAGTIGTAVPRPSKDPDKPSQVFRLHWARVVKSSGVRKSRACLDGSRRAAPWLRMMVQTYSSCVELPCLRAFLAICATRGYYICFGDVENAYQQSPPPSVDCYLEIDDTVYDWYLRRFGIKLNKLKDVIPLFRALQGHPEAGVLWERLITDILINKMGFKNTTHERNLYTGTIDGVEVLVCRQVDDFAAGAPNQTTAEQFIKIIQEHVRAEFAGMGVELPEGVHQRYNGIDIFQTKDYIKVGAESYIDRMLQTHGWDAPGKHESDPNPVPLRDSSVNRLMNLQGPPEKSPEAKQLAIDNGFSYRNVLGELIYAYVICRLDIGYAVCFLARFSDAPHDEHYKALKQVCRYLRATKSWGILYKRPEPLADLPDDPFDWIAEDSSLPPFPVFEFDRLVGFLDAAHATDLKTRRSVTGYLLILCGAAIAWKSRIQPIVATSSTEAEFYAGVTCAKAAKYLRYVLQELDALREGPTPLYIDNEAAIAMINENRPTTRARHIEIQHFAIQEWRAKNDLVMRHIPGIINPSDDLTKALGWVLHSRHARRGMGHYRIGSPQDLGSPDRPPMLDQGSSKSGRVLEPIRERPSVDGRSRG